LTCSNMSLASGEVAFAGGMIARWSGDQHYNLQQYIITIIKRRKIYVPNSWDK